MTWHGSCPCGAVRFSVDGPVRDVIVCHCAACQEATGGPWAASAAYRRDLSVEDETALTWEAANVSEHGASRGRCSSCGTVVFWDAPGRETRSFAAATLVNGPALEVAGHIWVSQGEGRELRDAGLAVEPAGMPEAVSVRWRGEAAAKG